MDSYCPVCERAEETTYHVLWQCPAARNVWSVGCIKFPKSCLEGPSFLQVVEGMLKSCDQMEFAQFANIARRIWLWRNEMIHGGDFLHPNILIQQATRAVNLFHLVWDEVVLQEFVSDAPTQCNWKNPPIGWFKANWDAGVNQHSGRVGLGVVIRDHQGKMWVAKSMTRLGFLDPTLAETMVVRLCTKMGMKQVQLEGDAKVVVDAVNSLLLDKSATGLLTEDLCIALCSFSSWELGYVRREGNKVAHILASLALQNEMGRVWIYEPPDCIRETLHAEVLALQCMTLKSMKKRFLQNNK
ncbi:uncharacterized protein LOC132174335 [Corylus avellana]|uniref:uncharacterized protein LOC132174335 n=1 Tax=Corylus avellana TaxID=13451 RepID=UPI001E1F4F56|nr:uncharacterized protein LOC132174335 [Corylus avellana]